MNTNGRIRHATLCAEESVDAPSDGGDIRAVAKVAHSNGDTQTVVDILNDALASKVVSVMRYRRHYFMAQGLAADAIKKEFLLHAEQEQAHADKIAKRIVELGGRPNFNPRDLTSQSHAEYAAGKDLENMIREDLIAERGAAESIRAMTTYLASRDPTSVEVLDNILAAEEEQSDELNSMLRDLQSLLSLWRAPFPVTARVAALRG